MIKATAIAATLLAVSGCSTIMTGTTQTITVDTPLAAGAKCVLSDTKSRTWQVPTTPASLVVEKGDGPMTIICEKDGFNKTTAVIDEKFAGATLGNILIGGGIGVIIDATSGAAQRYPDKMTIWMLPIKFASAAEERQWQTAKADWEAAEEKRNSID